MTTPSPVTPPPVPDPSRLVPVRVWDWPVRVFHWTLLALVVFSVATAKVGGLWMDWHMRSGYAVLALVAFRIAWGFAGTRWARWSSFVHGPARALRYARTLVVPPHENTVGHNPLGGYMVVALVALLLSQAVTGLFANDDILTEGPLVKLVDEGDLGSADLDPQPRREAALRAGGAARRGRARAPRALQGGPGDGDDHRGQEAPGAPRRRRHRGTPTVARSCSRRPAPRWSGPW